MNWKKLFEVYLTEREVDLLCQACQAHMEAARDDKKFELVNEWGVIQTKLECVKGKTQ